MAILHISHKDKGNRSIRQGPDIRLSWISSTVLPRSVLSPAGLTHDAIGQRVSDDSGKIANIIWDAYHKIRESQMIIWLYLSPASGEPTHIWFEYDGLGNRVSKEVERNLNNAEFFHDVQTGHDLSLPRPVRIGRHRQYPFDLPGGANDRISGDYSYFSQITSTP
ncbi:MAG: hypothetical protein R3D00_22825 [Bacteroidia bacterium]